MYFKRKAYDQLLEWKEKYADKYAVLLEGARRVGKSTIAEQFAKNEYKSYILIDFSKASDEEMACFDDINDLDMFFLRLQAVKRVDLYEQESVIIFVDAGAVTGKYMRFFEKVRNNRNKERFVFPLRSHGKFHLN